MLCLIDIMAITVIATSERRESAGASMIEAMWLLYYALQMVCFLLIPPLSASRPVCSFDVKSKRECNQCSVGIRAAAHSNEQD